MGYCKMRFSLDEEIKLGEMSYQPAVTHPMVCDNPGCEPCMRFQARVCVCVTHDAVKENMEKRESKTDVSESREYF